MMCFDLLVYKVDGGSGSVVLHDHLKDSDPGVL